VTDSAVYRSAFVVGADGSRSVVAGSMKLSEFDYVIGIETEVVVDDADMSRWESRVVVDLGWIPGGYAWLFPKSDHLSIGIASLRKYARNLQPAYGRFLSSLDLNRHELKKSSSGVIRVCSGTPRVVHGRIALVGDAAGLADPLTGEGIHHALLSGQLAASAIEDAFVHSRADLDAYQQAVEDTIMPEIRAARAFSRVLRVTPKKLLDLVKKDDRIWRAGCSLVGGDTTYSAVMERVSSLGGLYSMLTRK
jgi:flavin-dependent dehydrogenase